MFENPGIHISRIVTETPCPKHRASMGVPCWIIPTNTLRGFYPAVCGKRIKRAGFIGKISPQSMRMKSEHAKRPPQPRKFSKRPDNN